MTRPSTGSLKMPVETVLRPCGTSLGNETFTESSFILWLSSLLDVAGRRARLVLYQFEPYRRARAQGAVPLARDGGEVEEHAVLRGVALDLTYARVYVERAYHALRHRQAVLAEWRRAVDPLLLWNSNLFGLRRVVCLVVIVRPPAHDLAQVLAQLFERRTPDEEPAIVDLVNRQVGAQDEGEGPRDVGVLSLGLVEDADALDDLSLFVGQEGPFRPQPGAEGCSNQRGVGADRHELTEVHCQLGLELDQPAHVLLVARAEEAAAEDQDERVTVGEAELLVHGAGFDVSGEPARLFAVIR